MQTKNGIFIKNVYYMLAYAFKFLKQKGFANIQPEKFDSVWDLLSVILCKGVSAQIGKGVFKQYVPFQEEISTVKGKICFKESMSNLMSKSQKLVCEFDAFSENILLNQVIKSTILNLIRSDKVKYAKPQLKRLLIYFNDVDEVDLKTVNWFGIKYNSQNESYKMLINICYLVSKNMILSTRGGKCKLPNFVDENSFHLLFQEFVLNYYKTHFHLNASARKIDWFLTEAPKTNNLPDMNTDITLRLNEKTLIIDTKFYASTMQEHFGKKTFHSANMYQIFTYVKNLDVTNSGNVAGMLLYAKTPDTDFSDWDNSFKMGNNLIVVSSLDLSNDFKTSDVDPNLGVSNQLDKIVFQYFGNIEKFN